MKFKRSSKSILNKLGLCLVVFSTMIVNTNCLGFIGEPDPPKSLLE